MKHIVLSLFLVLMSLSLLPDIVAAQGLPVDGKDFYIGYVYPSFNKAGNSSSGRNTAGFFAVYALISSYEADNKVTIAYFDPQSGQETTTSTVTVGARNAVQVQLNQIMMKMDEPGDIPQWRACHITAKKPVNVQYFSTGACSGGSYLAIPTPALGKNYVIPSYFDNPGQGAATNSGSTGENAGGFFLIVSAFDGTNVSITPNETTAGGHTGKNSGKGADNSEHPYTVTLARGQCYWVKGDGKEESNDISGSLVVADKPIAVLAGHEDAFLGDVGARYVDARDFMIEQVIPAEYWDSTGYVGIPLVDASPLDETQPGYGENYRVYTDNPKGAAVELNNCFGNSTFPTGRLAFPTPEKINIGCPVEMHSTDGHKFGVMLYDLRGQGTTAPYPAESMMSIVPMSRWRTSYLFYVAANTFEVLQNYYINIIGLRKDIDGGNIQYAFNGTKALTKVNQGLTLKGSFPNIPNHPELKGERRVVHPGAYYLTNVRDAILHPLTDAGGIYHGTPEEVNADTTYLHGAFMVYHYGMRALDPDRDLGDFCGDDFFFSYALPIGMTVSSGKGNPTVKVDTFCSSWQVCVHDSVPIKSITLIDDQDGNVYRPGKKSFNTHFDELLDPENKGEIVFDGVDTSVCVTVTVSNPFDSAYAPLVINDAKGTPLFIDLRYKAPHFTLREVSKTLSMADTLVAVDTILYPPMRVGSQACSTIVYVNTGAKGDKAFTVTDVSLKIKSDKFYTIASVVPALPAILKGGDTLKVQICFSPTDTTKYEDSLIVTTDCFIAPLPLLGKGGTPLIIATDIDFGSVVLGSSKCADLTVTNVGSLPFNLTPDWLLHNKTVFSMDAASVGKLPVVLNPGKSIVLTFCYKPDALRAQDSTTVDWITDIDKPFTDQIKSWSYLVGKPIKPGVNWDRPTQLDSVICDDSVVTRVNLLNTSNAQAHVTNMFFDGIDAAQYHILTTQRGTNPGAFDMNPGDIIWVDVVFKANLANGYADRKSRLVATYYNNETKSDDSTTIDFTGKVQHAILTIDPPILNLGFVTRGVPVSGFVTAINSGDAPFIVNTVNFPNPPITAIKKSDGTPLSLGDTIGRGDTVTFEIDNQLDVFTDTTVDYTISSMKVCSDAHGSVQIASSSLKVATTDFPAPQTFVGCRESDSTIKFTNLGSVKITLESVDIISTPGTPNVGEFDLKDNTGKLVKSVFPAKLLDRSEFVTIPIVYHPSIAGPVSATISYTYDSAGTKFTITRLASGNGLQLKTTLSAAQASGQPYTDLTGAIFNVPISLATTALPANADARRVTFTLTYRQDVVDLNRTNGVQPAAGYSVANANPTQNHPIAGDESIDIDVSSTTPAPISSLTDLVTVNYQVMVAQKLSTPFIVSNVTFYDSKGVAICYIAADTIPGLFVPGYQCGDSTLNKFLQGVIPTRIVQVTPNVITESETPVLVYSVNRSDLPVRVEIFNVLGEKVRTVKNTLSQPKGDYKLPVGIMGLPSGTYTLRLTTPVSSETANFIIQK